MNLLYDKRVLYESDYIDVPILVSKLAKCSDIKTSKPAWKDQVMA